MFHIYAANGPNRFEELDLPASDYEMLDLMDRLRLAPGQLPYMEILEYSAHDFLAEHMVELPDIFQLNVLARQLSELDTHGMATFEGLAGMDIQKKETPIPLPRLIDFAHSADCCHVVEEVVTDYELGKFLAENDFVPETEGLSEPAFKLLDFAKIGKEHREAEASVFTGFGYVERHDEVRHISEAMDFQPKAPAYTILLNMAAIPLKGAIQPEDMVQLRLPAPEAQVQAAMEHLGAKNWYDVAVSIWDSPIPHLNHELYPSGETPLILELAQRLSELEARSEMLKYKAVLAAEDTRDLPRMLEIASALDGYILETKVGSPEDVAREELELILCEQDAETLIPHVNLRSYGCALLERDQAVITSYGLLEHRAPEQMQDMDQESPSERMVLQ